MIFYCSQDERIYWRGVGMHSLFPVPSPPPTPALISAGHCFLPFSVRLHEMLGLQSGKQPEESGNGSGGQQKKLGGADPSSSLFNLLIECATAISQGDWPHARLLLSTLLECSSVQGDATERVVAHFTAGLVRRLPEQDRRALPPYPNQEEELPSPKESQVAYLALNEITPFVRFAHLTANQAILEALEGSDSVHIVDFEIMQGVQWPLLMQALAVREGGAPRRLRITGIGTDGELVDQTGNRLIQSAMSLGIPFEFRSISANAIEEVNPGMLDLRPGEALAVNFVFNLHHLLVDEEEDDEDASLIASYLSIIRSLEPKVVTLAERELATHNQPFFLERFKEALCHYLALFDSLDATLPPSSSQRMKVEQSCFRPEITMMMLKKNSPAQGSDRIARHQKFPRWCHLFRSLGFNLLPPSTFALSQARLLLRLRYPCEAYQINEEDGGLFLGWRDTPLFAVSAWN